MMMATKLWLNLEKNEDENCIVKSSCTVIMKTGTNQYQSGLYQVPMLEADKIEQLLKEGVFSRVVKFLSKIPPPHTAVRVALFVHSCSAFFVTRLLMQLQQMVPTFICQSLLLHSAASLVLNLLQHFQERKALTSFVSPSSCTVLLLWCLTYYSTFKREKH